MTSNFISSRTERKEVELCNNSAKLYVRWDDKGGNVNVGSWNRPAGMEFDEWFNVETARFLVVALTEYVTAKEAK